MTRKKILILFTSSELGGAEKSLTRLASKITNKIDIQLATMDGVGPWVDLCNKYNFNPIILGNRKDNGRHGTIDFKSISKLCLLIFKEKFDIVYGVGLRLSIFIRFIILFTPKTKYINAIRWHPASPKLVDKVFRLVERYFSFLIDFYICNSAVSKNLLIEKCKVHTKKIRVIYNGIENKKSSLLNKENNEPVLLITSNFSPRKGLAEFLLKVIKPLYSQGNKFHLFLAGRDEMNGLIKKIVKDNNLEKVVTILGFVDEIDNFFIQSDIFILRYYHSRISDCGWNSLFQDWSQYAGIQSFTVKGNA